MGPERESHRESKTGGKRARESLFTAFSAHEREDDWFPTQDKERDIAGSQSAKRETGPSLTDGISCSSAFEKVQCDH